MKKLVIVIMVMALTVSLASAKDESAARNNAKANPVTEFRGMLDCSTAIPINCGDAVVGTTVGAANNVSEYSCSTWPETGGEAVYELVLDAAYVVNATLAGMAADLDVFFLDGCEEANCLAFGNTMFSATAGPGTYYIVVDGYNGAEDIFSMYVECNLVQDPAPLLEGGDTCAEATDLQAAGLTRWSVDLSTYTDIYDGGGCFFWHLPGGDAVYKIDLEAGEDFVVTMDGPCDMSMYLFTYCEGGVAMACTDAAGGGGQEVMNFTAPDSDTYYLVLDTFQTAGCEVIMSIEGLVAVDEESWDSMKAMYR